MEEKFSQNRQARIEKKEQEIVAVKAIRDKQIEEDSFYQKLRDGLEVNILIIGDSIGSGAPEGAWSNQLSAYLQSTYFDGVDNLDHYIPYMNVTNVSMGGNASYAGYVRTMALADELEYDLAIICYGQNDGKSNFSTNYESIIRAVSAKYPNCSIISILESSQREYTEKMKEIQKLCEHYDIPIADTIKAFDESEFEYEQLSNDGVHPNNEGQNIYFETIREIIDENVKNSTGKMAVIEPLNIDVKSYDNFAWYGTDNKFVRRDDVSWTADVSGKGILGIDYTYQSGDNKASIYLDGKLFESPTVTFDYDFSQRHILVISEDCSVKNEIKIVFDSKEQADGFYGMCFSWE